MGDFERLSRPLVSINLGIGVHIVYTQEFRSLDQYSQGTARVK